MVKRAAYVIGTMAKPEDTSAPQRGRDGTMRGYFGIGVERVSKPMNVGNLFRTAHAFGASFVFTVNAHYDVAEAKSDTSLAPKHMPYYRFDDVESMTLPQDCSIVGIEIVDGARELPSFRHPSCAAYVLGPERGGLSGPLLARCDHVVRIPTGFSLNVATAGAIVVYDRVITLGRFAHRPIATSTEPEPLPAHVSGGPVQRKRNADGARTKQRHTR
jgi:tRNA G18 (ribose-2'-O)-methylase SpoU